MAKRYYLIAQYRPDLGQSAENPGCLFAGHGPAHPWPLLKSLKPFNCYTSAKQAERYADKNRFYSNPCYHYDVVDVTRFVYEG